MYAACVLFVLIQPRVCHIPIKVVVVGDYEIKGINARGWTWMEADMRLLKLKRKTLWHTQ